jgi:hypothetical protein
VTGPVGPIRQQAAGGNFVALFEAIPIIRTMPAQDRASPFGKEKYTRQTLQPLSGLVFILPMLLFFHVGTVFCGTDLLAPRDIDVILRYFGATVSYLPAVLVMGVLLLQHLAHRERFRVEMRTLGGMFGESIGWMLPLIAAAHITGRMWVHQASAGDTQAASSPPLIREIIGAVGAGVYEEFIFRMVVISVLLLLLVDVFDLRKDIITVLSVVLAAVAFSLYHFSAGQFASWAYFPWHDFIFRATAGVYLGAVFVFRGFGIAVGAHAIYNIYAVLYTMSNQS